MGGWEGRSAAEFLAPPLYFVVGHFFDHNMLINNLRIDILYIEGSVAVADEVTFSVAEFARLVKRQIDYLHKLLRAGKLKGSKPYGEWRIPESELSKYWGIYYKLPPKKEGA